MRSSSHASARSPPATSSGTGRQATRSATPSSVSTSAWGSASGHAKGGVEGGRVTYQGSVRGQPCNAGAEGGKAACTSARGYSSGHAMGGCLGREGHAQSLCRASVISRVTQVLRVGRRPGTVHGGCISDFAKLVDRAGRPQCHPVCTAMHSLLQPVETNNPSSTCIYVTHMHFWYE